MKKFFVTITVLVATLAFASVATATHTSDHTCPAGQSAQGAYCENNPPGQPADRPPENPQDSGPPGQPEDRPPARPAAANTPSGASLTTARFLAQLGLEGLSEQGGYTRTFVAPGPGVYLERVYGRVFVPVASGSTARAAAHTRARYVLIAFGHRNFKQAGARQVKMRLSKRGAALIKRRNSLRIMVKTQFVATRNGRVTNRTTSRRNRTVSKKGTVATS